MKRRKYFRYLESEIELIWYLVCYIVPMRYIASPLHILPVKLREPIRKVHILLMYFAFYKTDVY